jgi:hypothetical protein
MARFDVCPNCGQAMPAGNLHCFGCGLDLPLPVLDSGSVLVQLYPGISQAAAFEFYRIEVVRLAAAGWYPIAHSWGDDRIRVGSAIVTSDVASSLLAGTLMVTYRQEGHA